jgi:hypothetical protein
MILRAYLFSVNPKTRSKELVFGLTEKRSNPSKSPMTGVFYTTRVLRAENKAAYGIFF